MGLIAEIIARTGLITITKIVLVETIAGSEHARLSGYTHQAVGTTNPKFPNIARHGTRGPVKILLHTSDNTFLVEAWVTG